MKTVSFRVAKALKEAGYPQGVTPYQYITKNYLTFKEGDMIDSFFAGAAGNNVVDAPYVMEIWLWLWREKKIHIYVLGSEFQIFMQDNKIGGCADNNDPEEVLIAAIEYLVTNNLIK